MKTPINYEVSELTLAEQQSIKGGSGALIFAVCWLLLGLALRTFLAPAVERRRDAKL